MLTLSILGALELYPSLPPIQKHSDSGRLCYGYDNPWLSRQDWGNSCYLLEWRFISNSSVSVDTEAIEPPSPGPMKPEWSIGLQMDFQAQFSLLAPSLENNIHTVFLWYSGWSRFQCMVFTVYRGPEWLLLDILFLFIPRNASIRIFSERQWYLQALMLSDFWIRF